MEASPERRRRGSPRWRRRLAVLMRPRRVVAAIEIGTLLLMIGVLAITYLIVARGAPERPLSPSVVALLLVSNLVPAMGVLVLFARRIARGRAERSPLGGRGRLHVRLVALFSTIAALPTLLVVIFASLLFQYGVQFWFSASARTVLQGADRVASAYVAENMQRISGDMRPMASDFRYEVGEVAIDNPRFSSFIFQQALNRGLGEVAMIGLGTDGVPRLIAGALADARPLERRLPADALPRLDGGAIHAAIGGSDRIEAAILLDKPSRTYLYASRSVDPLVIAQVRRTRTAMSAYNNLLDRSRTLQLQFNIALFVVSLLIVGIAIWIALNVADRLVRPIGDLVGAARRVAAGDLAVRVVSPGRHDEVGTLAAAFNRMTRRLQEQTGALESRRAFTEAVLSGVSAGVVSVDRTRAVTLMNVSAEALLRTGGTSPIGRSLAEIAPELDSLLDTGDREAVAQVAAGGDMRTLAVTIVATVSGHVLTFDDITQQLADQRRAAWADVARRIAHEIKNPLTPIQLAAERLQRRYGRDIEGDNGTFERLVSTIVRQVGDIRRMIDEFSSFARMPKPEFAREALVDIARQAMFLHEVAHPAIAFHLDAPTPSPEMVCDRRQLGQALTNIVKNAVEAIEARGGAHDEDAGAVTMTIAEDDGRISILVADNGVGLPAERERLTEPYMTTRTKGTGLGLAIVDKIVEEHRGVMSFADRPGGGSIVSLLFDPAALAPLADGGEEPAAPEFLLADARSL